MTQSASRWRGFKSLPATTHSPAVASIAPFLRFVLLMAPPAMGPTANPTLYATATLPSTRDRSLGSDSRLTRARAAITACCIAVGILKAKWSLKEKHLRLDSCSPAHIGVEKECRQPGGISTLDWKKGGRRETCGWRNSAGVCSNICMLSVTMRVGGWNEGAHLLMYSMKIPEEKATVP